MAKETKVATAATPPPPGIDWSADANVGFENVTQTDMGIPFLGIIQPGSPQFDVTKPKHAEKKITGCKPGDLFDTLGNSLIAQPAKFIPCGYQKLFVEWKSRDGGNSGGFVKTHRDEAILIECKRNERNQDILRNGNMIATTAYFHGFLMGEGELRQYVIGMTSTQLKKARQWLNMLSALKVQGTGGKFTPPFFSHYYLLTTVLENKGDNAWYGWQIGMGGPMTDAELIGQCRNTAKLVAQGKQLSLPTPQDDDDKI